MFIGVFIYVWLLVFVGYVVLLCGFCVFFFFFFKQKTAYEVRISDWSSDVCSSDLLEHICAAHMLKVYDGIRQTSTVVVAAGFGTAEIGRASCRERVCQYV